MRASPVIHEADFRLMGPPTARLPRPYVQKDAVLQTISLKPAGNTVAITTLAENPFDGGRAISVRTQQSGGMAHADGSQVSRTLLHAYLPGLGADAAPVVATPASKPAGALDFLGTATGAAKQLYEQEQAIKLAEQQAKIAQSQALIAQYSNPMVAMGQRKSITIPLLIVGGGALLTAAAIFFSRRKGGSKRRR